MPAIFEFLHTVDDTEIDGQGHANNISYLKWMQNAAIAHSDAQGWTTQRYIESGWSWVVRSHFIEYRRPVFESETVLVKTWVADMKKYSSLRKFQLVQKRSGKLLARAETNWAFVDRTSGRLIEIPEVVGSSFILVATPPKA